MNKKLALLRFLAQRWDWFSSADLTRELEFPAGSVSAYLTDLLQADLVKKREGAGGQLQYHSRLKFEEPMGSRN